MGADFSFAELTQSTFVEAHLWEANFVGAKLSDTSFARANIEGADFTDAEGMEYLYFVSAVGDAVGRPRLG